MDAPEGCSVEARMLMLKCWESDPALRPNFTEILSEITGMPEFTIINVISLKLSMLDMFTVLADDGDAIVEEAFYDIDSGSAAEASISQRGSDSQVVFADYNDIDNFGYPINRRDTVWTKPNIATISASSLLMDEGMHSYYIAYLFAHLPIAI